jgi:hypothetical protein
MFKDGTWKRELGEKDRIIALTTKLTKMQAKFEQQVTSFATQAASNKDNNNALAPKAETCHSKQEPYTVAAWHLVKKEDSVTMNGKEYFWCTGNHYSRSEKHNGMYADHKTSDHNTWRKTIDDPCATRNPGKPSNNTSASAATPAAAPAQKLMLNDKLWNAFCTQAGLSAKAIDCIWEDAQGNK